MNGRDHPDPKTQGRYGGLCPECDAEIWTPIPETSRDQPHAYVRCGCGRVVWCRLGERPASIRSGSDGERTAREFDVPSNDV